MINKTIGTGGDYADIGLAWAYLQSVDPISDDYTFTIISDFTENTGIAYATGNLLFNDKTVTISNPNNYTIINNNKGYLFRSAIGGGLLVLDGLIIRQTSPVYNDILISTSADSTLNTMSSICKNLKLYGAYTLSPDNVGIFLRIGDNNSVYNCSITGFGLGLALTYWAGSPVSISKMENCNIYGCAYGIHLNGSLFWTTQLQRFDFKNVVISGNSIRDWLNVYNSSPDHTITNCADSDNSIASSGAILSGNITGITIADFTSVTSTDSDFLYINKDSSLFNAGTHNISAFNTTDITGKNRPYNGRISIGIFEPEAPMVPSFEKLKLLTAKVQTALGTKATPAAADFITVDDTFSLEYKKEFTDQALAQGIFGNPQGVAGSSMVDCKVSLPIIPTGSATVPNVGKFLNCCGMVYALATSKHSWTPTSVIATNWQDMSLWGYSGDKTAGDAIITKAHSVMFDYEIAGEVGKPVVCTFTGKGVPDGVPAAGTYLTDSIAAIAGAPPAMLKNATQSINGVTMTILKFSVKGGNDVQLIKNMSDDSGYLQSMITNKKAEWSATVYIEDQSAKNPFTGMAAGTLATTTIKFGNATNYLVSITSGSNKSEIRDIKVGNDNGLQTYEITGTFVDNDFTIAINDA